MKTLLCIISFIGLMTSCSPEKSSTLSLEKYRPLYHFTPPKNWMNDPNGLVFYKNEYHLFYQHNPHGNTWGHMSWGHAVSRDLINWQHLPLAIAEYTDPQTGDSTMVFSGTVVVDENNTSGLCLGTDCLIALYTSHIHRDQQGLRQHQSLAYSNDQGRTWTRYDKNPVLDIQRKDFRDPKVFWYAPTKKWVMVLVIPDLFKVRFYESKNLLSWNELSEFGPAGDTSRIWECPDLYSLPVANESGKSKWVLSLSGSHPAGPDFVGMQYFVGDFDGNDFTADTTTTDPRYVDYGKDFYAGITYNQLPAQDDRTIMMGWVNNWAYGNFVPTRNWRSAMSVPRVLQLLKKGNEYLLIQQPVLELEKLRGEEVSVEGLHGGSFELVLQWNGEDGTILELFADETERTVIRKINGSIQLDRTTSGVTDFHKDFASADAVPVSAGEVELRVFVDQSIIELYINQGESVITSQVFPVNGNSIRTPEPEKILSAKGWILRKVMN
jgi:fructan beta-fructosidase